MKTTGLLVSCSLLCILLGCGADPVDPHELELGNPTRINGCTVNLLHQYSDLIDLQESCSAPESALRETQWWGGGPEPGMFSMKKNDCFLLKTRYYCLVDMDPPTVVFSYEIPRDDVYHKLNRNPALD